MSPGILRGRITTTNPREMAALIIAHKADGYFILLNRSEGAEI
jgi:hypothetical protein